jgi:GntR family transcriptional regulator, histidine utilization repressor
MHNTGWQSVRDEVRRRINERIWKPGDLIPGEAELAIEFGCARATVNRAMRSLAESGILDRRRKAGTRVARNPVRKATLEIPVVRDEITKRGMSYQYTLLRRELLTPPAGIRARMKVGAGEKLLHVLAVHLADGRPYVSENRWINLKAAPEAGREDFATRSPNEWLVDNIPFQGGDFSFSALSADPEVAEIMACREGEGLFVIDRTTWNKKDTITLVRLIFAPGYRMHTRI